MINQSGSHGRYAWVFMMAGTRRPSGTRLCIPASDHVHDRASPEVGKHALAHPIGHCPTTTIPGLTAYALTGQHFALRRQWLIKLVLQFAQTFFRGPDSAVGTVPARLPVSSSPLRDFLFQTIYFILGKREYFYMIHNM